MTHGAGGRAAAQLIDELFAAFRQRPYLRQGDDGAPAAASPPGDRW
jgi:hydrogenase expression/formation protein HypE